MDSVWEQEPEKCLKMPQNPQRPVHALLACMPIVDEPIDNEPEHILSKI